MFLCWFGKQRRERFWVGDFPLILRRCIRNLIFTCDLTRVPEPVCGTCNESFTRPSLFLPHLQPKTVAMSDLKAGETRPPVSVAEWSQAQLDELNVEITETSDAKAIIDNELTKEKERGVSP